ncbi:hypothetical protein GCM10007183_14510 [Staphylococcus muscae]|uniref:Antibiotic resistance protein VanZ n=1 Tax=Staphylococcus muscae TaxID=1294 RepID=A0ABQ1HVK7_9STAP|nr:hypothetical protein GCM10007183_14510 [Staphylococcus muscae]
MEVFDIFYGTRFFYKFLYFITAMTPAYFLFLLQIDDKFQHPFDTTILKMKLDVYWWCGILFLILFILALFLKWLIINQYKTPSTDRVLNNKKEKFKLNNLEEINGSIISFLLGNVLPAVLIIESNLLVAILIFIIIQILIYILIMKSTDIFPNIFLIILGIDLCKTEDDDYVFTFKSKKYEEFKVYHIGEPLKSRLYITMYEK